MTGTITVRLRNPRRDVESDGPTTADALLARLGLSREAHLVIRNGELVAGDGRLEIGDIVEVRPVISGGA
jgi:sulfur carrier protein ThiS